MHPHVVSVSAFSWCGASESERSAGLSVTGWRSRESLSAARRGESDMAKPFRKSNSVPPAIFPSTSWCSSQSNVRRVKAGVSIEQLAESIAQRTLLQSLSVRAVVDADGQETGMFEVPAGGRRYRALELLVKQKRMAKTQPVPCVVRDGGIAEDDSLAENDERVGLHPLDQFRAFKTAARRRHERRRYCRAALRDAGDRQAAAASGVGVAEAARGLCRRRHDARAAHGVLGHGRPGATGAGLGERQPLRL